MGNLRVFYMSDAELAGLSDGNRFEDGDGETGKAGWYYWFCFPGCIPEGDSAIGPFESEDDAREDAEKYFGED